VLLPVYNGAAYIAEAIESILAQTFRDFSLVIYEDGSTDDTLATIKRYDDPRIELRALAANRGRAPNLADGVQRTESDYIARMDADDVASSDRFEKQVAFLDRNPSIDLLGTNVVFFSESGETVGIQPECHEDIEIALLFGFTMLHPTVMMRNSALKSGGFNYDPALRDSEDYDLWVRMVRSRRFHNLQEPLLSMREHPAKETVAKRRQYQREGNLVRTRQLAELGLVLAPEDADVFFAAACTEPIAIPDGLMRLERVLDRVMIANRSAHIFDQPRLEAAAASFHRSACRLALMNGYTSGAAYWRSRLRRYERVSARELAGMAWRTGQALVRVRGRAP
jgi:glycosyltransferase involved in cell wall biosynthesis